MENEANSTVENAEAREKAIVAGAETTSAMAAKEETLQQATGELAAAAKLKERAQRSEQALRGQAERYALLLVRGRVFRDALRCLVVLMIWSFPRTLIDGTQYRSIRVSGKSSNSAETSTVSCNLPWFPNI